MDLGTIATIGITFAIAFFLGAMLGVTAGQNKVRKEYMDGIRNDARGERDADRLGTS